MKKILVELYLSAKQYPYLEKFLDDERKDFSEAGFDFSDEDILESFFLVALKKECEKYGYKG